MEEVRDGSNGGESQEEESRSWTGGPGEKEDGWLFEGWTGRREISKDRKSKRGKYRMCYGCGERGHLKKDCRGDKNKKDKGPQGRDL